MTTTVSLSALAVAVLAVIYPTKNPAAAISAMADWIVEAADEDRENDTGDDPATDWFDAWEQNARSVIAAYSDGPSEFSDTSVHGVNPWAAALEIDEINEAVFHEVEDAMQGAALAYLREDISAATDLDDLCFKLRWADDRSGNFIGGFEGMGIDTANLPKFGGEAAAGEGVVSWDETRLLIQHRPGRWQIVKRPA